MQGKKTLFLFLALLLPISIFIFLRLFGKNEFDVPAFYQDQKPVVNASCQFDYVAPYSVPDSIKQKLSERGANKLYLIYFNELGSRVKQEITDAEVSFVSASGFAGKEELETLRNCILITPADADLVAIDGQGKIRGYYTSTDREEIDRLLLEIEIILKKY